MPWQLLRRPSGDINHRWDRLTPDISPNHFLAITCCFCHTSYHPEFPPFVTLVLWNNYTHRSHSDRVAFVSCNKHWVCEVFNHLQKIEDMRKTTYHIHQRRERSQPQIPLIGSIFDCIEARKELWKMSRIVRDQYHNSTKTKTRGGRWWCWGWHDINFTDRAMAKRSIRLGTVFHNACRTNGASHHGCNIDGYIAGNGARTPSHLNLHQCVHQRKRTSTKNQIGVNSSVELTLAPSRGDV